MFLALVRWSGNAQVRSSSEESVSSSEDTGESTDELSLADDSSDEDRSPRKRPRPAQKKTNGVKPQEEPLTTAHPTSNSTVTQGLPPLLASQETPKLSADKGEKPEESPQAPPPIQSLSLLDRLRLGGSSSFSSLAPVRTKQLTLDEIFGPSSSTTAKPSEVATPAQAAVPTPAQDVVPTTAAGDSADPSRDSCGESAIMRTPPKPKRRRVLVDSDDDSVPRSANRSKASTPRRSAPSTPQKPKPRGTPKKHKGETDDDESDSPKGGGKTSYLSNHCLPHVNAEGEFWCRLSHLYVSILRSKGCCRKSLNRNYGGTARRSSV